MQITLNNAAGPATLPLGQQKKNPLASRYIPSSYTNAFVLIKPFVSSEKSSLYIEGNKNKKK